MLMNRINRADPEKVFIVAKNSWSTAALSNGQAVIWDYATDADGVGVTRPTAGAVRAGHVGVAFAGIVTEAIAVSDYGLLQVYGYHSAVRVRSQSGGTPAIVAGTALACVDSTAFVLHSFEPGTLATSTLTVHNAQYCGFALAAQAVWTTTAIACFIKGL